MLTWHVMTVCCLQLVQYACAAIDTAIAKQTKKQTETVAKAESSTDSRQRTELEAAAKNEEHKLKKVQEVQRAFQQLTAGESAALWPLYRVVSGWSGQGWRCT